MKKCSYCGADLPAISRFCGNCGSVQDGIGSNVATMRGKTPQQQSWVPDSGTIQTTWPSVSNDPVQGNVPPWSPNVQALGTPPHSVDENEDEDRRGVPLWSPLYGAALRGDALLGSGQVYAPGTPMVQGTPQIGNVPSVPGIPTSYTNPPASPAIQGAGNAASASPYMQGAGNVAPTGPSMLGAGNVPMSHPVQGAGNVPLSHPVLGTGNVPVGYPVHQPQPIPHPPEQPGTQQHHKPHRYHSQPLKHKSDHDDIHPVKHVVRRKGATKVAGGSTVKTIILVVTAVAVVAAGGVAAAAHFLSHPQPSLSITSNYKVGNTPVGANGTILHISGQQFSSNSAITFLLDGRVAPGVQGVQSDSNGNFSTNISIPNTWNAGPHTLSARDASNYSPQKAVSVTIVQQGQANTPGPNGAPPDDASFKVKVTIASRYRNVADPFGENPVLIITGHPDPEGGTVCSPDDNGQPFSFNETDTLGAPGVQFNKTLTAACSGTYKAGQISLIETSTSVKQYWQYSNGVNITCVLTSPTVDLRLTGAYMGNNTFKGTLNSPRFSYTCNQGGNTYHNASQGVHWTGTIVTQ